MKTALAKASLAALAATMLGCGTGPVRYGTHVTAGENLEKSTPRSSGDATPNGGTAGGGDGTTGNPSGGATGDGATGGGTGDGTAGAPSGGGGTTSGSATGGTTGGGTTGGTGGGSDAGGTTGGTTGAPVQLTCFGPAPALSPDFQAFCAQIPADLKTAFATAYDEVCNQQHLVNLLYPSCSYEGSGSSGTYRRVLAMTDLADTASQTFSFFAAYGATSELTLEGHLALIFDEMTDPNYAQKFVTITNSHVYDVAPIPTGGYDYTVDFASSAATVTFRAHLTSWTVTPNLTVVFDYDFADEVILQKHRFLRFLVRTSDNKTRMIGIDEKLIDDAGNHEVAYANLTDVLQQRQERDYVNSTRPQ